MRGFLPQPPGLGLLRRLAAAGICLLLPVSWAPVGTRADAAVSVATYRARIHHLRLTLDAQPAASPSRGRRAESQLRALATVRLADGRTISTPAAGWAQELQSGQRGEEQDVARQVTALDAALGPTHAASVNPAAMSRLDAILRHPRFQHPQLLPDLIRQWLGNLLLRLLSLLSGSNGGLSLPVAVLFAVVLLGLVAGLAYLLGRRALGRMVVEVAPNKPSSEPVTATAATKRASDLVAAGDYRAALRYLFLATLLELQQQKLLTLRPGMTNREYLRSLDLAAVPSPARHAALAELTEQFDRAWYGHLPFGAADYARCEGLARTVTTPQAREPAA